MGFLTNILKNKYFILGNLALLLAAIPLTLLFVSRQQDIQSRAEPSTSINFSPQTISFDEDECTEQTTSITLDPGENIVSTVELYLTYDATNFDITIEPNEDVFPEILQGPSIDNGEASVTMRIGGSVTDGIQEEVDIATVTIIPIAATTDSTSNIRVDNSNTRVLSINTELDDASENVLLNGGQASVSIDPACVEPTEVSPSPSPSPSPEEEVGGEDEPTATPTPTTIEDEEGTPTPTATESASPTPTSSISPQANQSPVCTTLASSPSAVGTAPFVLTLTSQGSDSDGTIQKATFDFGDSTIQDVTEGMGTASVTTELSHTYQTAGTYSASVVFTDNSGALSSSCTTQITVNEGESGETQTTLTPTATPTTGGIAPTATFTPTPTIEAPGSTGTTIAILAGIFLIILGGTALISL